MMNDESGIENGAWLGYVTNVWSRTAVQPILIAAMTAALVAGPLIVLQTAAPSLPWRAFNVVAFFIALESIYTAIWLNRPRQRSLNKTAYRVAEFIVIALIVRLLAWAFSNSWPDTAVWQSYLVEPLTFLNDPFFLVMLVLIAIIWQHAIYTGTIFARLSLDAAEAAYYATVFGKHKPENRPTITNREALLAGFLQRWLWGGLILVISAALSTFDLALRDSWLAMARLALPPQMITALLVYFLAGFLLLSQGRLAMMNARWLLNGVTKSPQVERSWYRNSWRLLAVVGLVAAFLPLGSTIGLSRIIGAVVSTVTTAALYLWLLIITLLSWLLSFWKPDAAATPHLPPPPPLPATPPPAPPVVETGEPASLLFNTIFWAVIGMTAVIAIIFFLHDRGFRLGREQIRHVWAAFRGWLAGLWRGLSKQAGGIRQAIQARRAKTETADTEPSSPWRFIRLNALSPRDKLRYFYLSTVRRAGQQGVERGQSATPLEYAQSLREQWPDAEMDVASLTEAFLEARYSPNPIAEQAVNPIKQHWKRLRARLRRRSRIKNNDM